jgi:hypothetical protein
MPLTADAAADVARRHGLTLQDAAALRALADDEQSADKIAARFAPPTDDDTTEATRQLARNLFDAKD